MTTLYFKSPQNHSSKCTHQDVPKGSLPPYHGASNDDRKEQELYSEKNWFEETIKQLSYDGEERDGILYQEYLKTGLDIDDKFRTPIYNDNNDILYTFSFNHMNPTRRMQLNDLCKTHPNKYLKCKLEIRGVHTAICVPEENEKITKIRIDGRSKCGQAFNGDTVVAEVYESLDAPKSDQSTRRGRVIGTVERSRFRDIEHPVFVCSIDDFEGQLMIPRCKTVPKVHITNKRVKDRHGSEKDHYVEIYKYDESKGYAKYDRFCKIKPEERAYLIFLVALLKWDTDRHYPLGIVMGIEDTRLPLNRMRILEIQHRKPSYYKRETVEAVKEIQEIFHPKEANCDDITVFTIDEKTTKVRDDGLSIEKLSQNQFKVGVHIANVSSVIDKNSPIDEEARDRCQTTITGNGAGTYHMFPEPLSTDLLSLQAGESRHVLSLFFVINVDGEVEELPTIDSIQVQVIKPKKNFSYEEVQNALDSTNNNNDPISIQLKQLFGLAKNLRKRRLKGAFYSFDFISSMKLDGTDNTSTYEAHYLVEEFMILTNETVATILEAQYPDCIPLRCHDHPRVDETKSWLDKYVGVSDIIMYLQDKQVFIPEQRLLGLEVLLKNCNGEMKQIGKIKLDKQIWGELKNAMRDKNYRRVRIVLGTDDYHPRQSIALQEWKEFQNHALYRCSGLLQGKKSQHFNMGLPLYVKATSPIRRYLDLVIQRLLVAAKYGNVCPYTKEEVFEICRNSNEFSEEDAQYNDHYQRLVVGDHIMTSQAIKYIARISHISETNFTLYLPEFTTFENDTAVKLNLLGLCSQPSLKNESSVRAYILPVWRKRIYDKKRIAFHTRLENADYCYSISPSRSSFLISPDKWVALINASIDHESIESEETEERLITLFNEIQGNDSDEDDETENVLSGENEHPVMDVADVSSEVKGGGLILNHSCHFQRLFQVGDAVTVQIRTKGKNGYPIPSIQMVYITDTIGCCLQHVENPILCFLDYTTMHTKQIYRNENDYIKSWLPIMEIEAVTNIVKNENSPLVKNIPVNFDTSTSGSFSLNVNFCRNRYIDFGFNDMHEDSEDCDEEDDKENMKADEADTPFQNINCCEYLCIRCQVSSRNQSVTNTSEWVGHAKTTMMRKLGKGKAARYELCFTTIRSPELPTGRFCCSMEMLIKSKVYRRAEKIIRQLKESTRLAKDIALRKPISPLDARHLSAVRRLQRDIRDQNIEMPLNNQSQQAAIDKALGSRFSLIQGPPGTGKTFTAIKLVYLFHQLNNKLLEAGGKRRILFFGPSNKSVDLVARWMKERFKNSSKAPRLVRFYGQSYECMDFPVPGYTVTSRRSNRDAKTDDYLKENDAVLHHLIRKEEKPFAADILSLDDKFKNNLYQVSFADVQKYFRILSEATQEELKNYDVIFCTTAMAANPKLLNATKETVKQCIIDECGMCTEPETMVPIIATEAEQVVLIGDHKQLQPILQSRYASELGLLTSLFESYAMKHTPHLTMLIQQYRMNPWICKFPSNQFYEGKVKTDEGNRSAWYVHHPLKMWKNKSPSDHIPILFWHVEGHEKTLEVSTKEGNEKSKSNPEEVGKVVELFTYMVEKENVDQKEIRIISQYNAQRHEIQAKLAKKSKDYESVKVNTVVTSQGAESNYVILSTVRSLPRNLIEPNPVRGWLKRNLGFIIDDHQINVALTRAKKGLIIIGNKHLLRCDKNWKALLKFYEENNRVFNKFPL